jgi:sugar lactone lactonase YvrE
MERVRGRWYRATVIALTAAALTATGLITSAALAAPGDIYVADEDATAPAGDGAIFKVGPSGGAPTQIAFSPSFVNPSGMVLNTDGTLLVADYGGFNHTPDGAIYQVNPSTGAVSTFAAGPALTHPSDLAFGPDGKLYVADQGVAPDGPPQLVRLDPNTKAATVIATGGSGNWETETAGIAVARDGTIYFTDYDNEVLKRDPSSGAIATLATDATLLRGADGLALSPDGRTLYVAAFTGSPNHVTRVDTQTGAVTQVAGVDDTVAVSLLPDGSLLSSDTDPVTGGVSGKLERIIGSTVSDFSADPAYDYPHDTVIEPQRCAGLFPTVVGTSGNDTLVGSRFADVISTLGGKDKVKGGGGKDVICGGPGKDKLFGQAGNDRLFGQGGKDTLVGGKGKDKLIGGKGTDKLKCTPIDPRCKQ